MNMLLGFILYIYCSLPLHTGCLGGDYLSSDDEGKNKTKIVELVSSLSYFFSMSNSVNILPGQFLKLDPFLGDPPPSFL